MRRTGRGKPRTLKAELSYAILYGPHPEKTPYVWKWWKRQDERRGQ